MSQKAHVKDTDKGGAPTSQGWADVMTKRDMLYRGTIHDLMLASDGGLSGLLITKPHRFLREKYLDDLKKYLQGPKTEAKPNSEN
jgi:hypothetical protein